MSEDPWCCSYDRRGKTCPACKGEFRGSKKEHNWRELHQHDLHILDEAPIHQNGGRRDMKTKDEDEPEYDVPRRIPVKIPVPSGDYYEGIEEGIDEGCKAGEAQERRIWRMAIERYFDATAVEDVERYVEEIRAGGEGE